MKTTASKLTAAQRRILETAADGAPFRVDSMATGNSFAVLARAGLMTHCSDRRPEPGFYQYVIGSIVYITDAGRAAL